MSFLNPVNEPVIRFSSTDDDAPQINYNSRTAGDVKAVLKACLVTGYGTTASAGWSIVNEVDHVCEFVSPDAAMSDYRFGVDDTSTSRTTWYYQHLDVMKNPRHNRSEKSFDNADKTNATNGWDLIVSSKGFYFIERVMNNTVQKQQARLTWFGSTKLALLTDDGHNMAFWAAGYQSPVGYVWRFFKADAYTERYYKIADYTELYFAAANISIMSEYPLYLDQSTIDMAAELYLIKKGVLIAQHPGIILTVIKDPEKSFGVYETLVNNRPALYVNMGVSSGGLGTVTYGSKGAFLYLDYWEY